MDTNIPADSTPNPRRISNAQRLDTAITASRSPAVEVPPRASHGIGGDLGVATWRNTTNEVSGI